MPWPITDVTHNNAQLGLPDIGFVIKGLVVYVYYVVWLSSMKGMGLRNCARFVDLVPCCGQDDYRAQVPQHSI